MAVGGVRCPSGRHAARKFSTTCAAPHAASFNRPSITGGVAAHRHSTPPVAPRAVSRASAIAAKTKTRETGFIMGVVGGG